MKFYSIEFDYRQPDYEEMRKWLGAHDSDTEFSPASHALIRAEDLVRQHLSRLEVRHLPEYSWPDGSLYYFIVTDRDPLELQVEFDKLENERACRRDEPINVGIKRVREQDPDKMIPIKHNRMDPKGPAIDNVRDYFRVYVSEEVPNYILRLLHAQFHKDGFLDLEAKSTGIKEREFDAGEEVWIVFGTVVVRCKITEVDDQFRRVHPAGNLFYDVGEPIGHSLSEDELYLTKEEALEALEEEYDSWVNNEHDCDKKTCEIVIARYLNDTLQDLRRKQAEFIGATHEGNNPKETKTPFVQSFADDLLKRYPEKIEGKDWFRVTT